MTKNTTNMNTMTMTQQTPTPQFLNEYGLPFVAFRLINNDKKPYYFQKDKDYPKELNGIEWTLYNQKECDIHNKWVKRNKKKANFVNVLPSQNNFLVIDFDSQEEVDRAKSRGFPVEAYHTLSSRKRLPHYFVKIKSDKPIKTWRGKTHNIENGVKVERELDLMTTNTFEDLDGMLYGDYLLQDITIEELCEVLEIDPNSIEEDYTHEQKRNPVKKTVIKKSKAVKKKTPPQNANPITWDNYNYSGELIGKSNKNKGMEIIEYRTLKELILNLDPTKLSDYANWFKLVCAIANQVKTNTDPYKYLNLLNNFCKGMDKFDEAENEKVFTQIFLQADSKPLEGKVKAKQLWNWLNEHNKKVWEELAFNKDRPLDPYEFGELELYEALRAFNINHCVIKGELTTEFIEWDSAEKRYKTMGKGVLQSNYDNLYYKIPVHYTEKEITKIEKDILYFESEEGIGMKFSDPPQVKDIDQADKKKFLVCLKYYNATITEEGERIKKYNSELIVPEWITWKGRKTFERDGFYPKSTAPYGTFNLFQGFEVDKHEDYNEKVDSLSKEELESELEFVFQHIRNIMGSDKTDELTDFFLKYMAHLIKYPNVIPRVAWFIHGQEGSGKNQLLNLFTQIIGGEYGVSTTNGNNIFGQFNSQLNHKIIVNFNEVSNVHTYIEDIKSVITDETINTTKKGKEVKTYRNVSRVFFFGNNANKVPIGYSDRRWIVCETGIAHKSIEGYNTKLAEQVSSLYIQKCMKRYLTEFVKVDKYEKFEDTRPLTDSYYNIRSLGIPYQHRFIQYLYEKMLLWDKNGDMKYYSETELWSMFERFKKDWKEPYDKPRKNMIVDFKKHVGDTNEDMIFHMKTRPEVDRKKYGLVSKERINKFMEKFHYDWEGVIETLPSSDEDEDSDCD